MRGIASSTIILGGQAIWAVAQALVVVALARFAGLETVGLFMLALAVFAPICLITGLNLRALLAVDEAKTIDIRIALRIRACSILTALMITGGIMALATEGFSQQWLAILLLVATRAGDQSADVAAGWYQRSNRHARIGGSFAARGAFSLVPFLIVLWLGGDLILAAALMLTSTLVAHALIDLRPMLSTAPRHPAMTLRTFIQKMGSGIASAPYPLLDSIHANSLRYSVAGILDTTTLGLVGIAQTLFVPIQLMLSAIGFNFLTRARQLVVAGDRAGQMRHLLGGMLCALIVGSTFLSAAAIVPADWLGHLFATEGAALKLILIIVAVANLPLPLSSFVGHTLTALRMFRVQMISVLLALAIQGLIIFALVAFYREISIIEVASVFFSTYVFRVIISMYILKRMALKADVGDKV